PGSPPAEGDEPAPTTLAGGGAAATLVSPWPAVSARPPEAVVGDLARTVRAALLRRGLRALRLDVPAMRAGRLSVELRAGRRLARSTVTTDPARTVTLRLRPVRRAARRVVIIVRHGDTARRLAVRLAR
ncbi:MAG TPA: hypothetical protein VFX80_10435, partial [Solirubrobacteraceae bacterium]|nr:hypothetical protein [Solirubrobacteraceae bacterium]